MTGTCRMSYTQWTTFTQLSGRPSRVCLLTLLASCVEFGQMLWPPPAAISFSGVHMTEGTGRGTNLQIHGVHHYSGCIENSWTIVWFAQYWQQQAYKFKINCFVPEFPLIENRHYCVHKVFWRKIYKARLILLLILRHVQLQWETAGLFLV